MNNARFVLVKLAGVTLLLAVQTPARAADVFFNPGFLFSAGGGERAVGLGGEASLMAYPNDELWGYGGFLQAQSFGGDYARYAAGFQTGSLVGAEAGLVALTASDEHRSSMGAHLGAFVSLAVSGAGLRVTVPVGSGSPDDWSVIRSGDPQRSPTPFSPQLGSGAGCNPMSLLTFMVALSLAPQHTRVLSAGSANAGEITVR
jgi:hypothetical protein